MSTVNAPTPEATVRHAEAAFHESLAERARLAALADDADRALRRAAGLTTHVRLVSEAEFERLRTEAVTAAARRAEAGFRVDRARAVLAEARERLRSSVIVAPIAGRVNRIHVKVGEVAVAAEVNEAGTVLMTYSGARGYEAEVTVRERDIQRVRVGQPAQVWIRAYPDAPYAGRVASIGQQALRDDRAPIEAGRELRYPVTVELGETPPSVRSDMSLEVDIVTAVRPEALTVPVIAATVRLTDESSESSAGVADGGNEGVFVVQNDRARFVPVTLGIAADGYLEVTDGLSRGDRVVAGPHSAVRNLRDGTPLRFDVRRLPCERSGECEIVP